MTGRLPRRKQAAGSTPRPALKPCSRVPISLCVPAPLPPLMAPFSSWPLSHGPFLPLMAPSFRPLFLVGSLVCSSPIQPSSTTTNTCPYSNSLVGQIGTLHVSVRIHMQGSMQSSSSFGHVSQCGGRCGCVVMVRGVSVCCYRHDDALQMRGTFAPSTAKAKETRPTHNSPCPFLFLTKS